MYISSGDLSGEGEEKGAKADIGCRVKEGD
jgi:hypothetical protein